MRDFVRAGVNVPADRFQMPDNLAFDARGNLFILEDMSGSLMRSLNRNDDVWAALPDEDGDGLSDGVYRFAAWAPGTTEPSGAVFSPDGTSAQDTPPKGRLFPGPPVARRGLRRHRAAGHPASLRLDAHRAAGLRGVAQQAGARVGGGMTGKRSSPGRASAGSKGAAAEHKWEFRARFRRGAFGWRSSRLAVARIEEAVSEIKKAARRDPVLGAEGAVLFLEKLSPALEQVDSSSGALGTAVNRAIEALVPIIAGAPADDDRREAWLERLWQAVEEDDIPYIEPLADCWGELCVTPERASRWADRWIDVVRLAWSPDPRRRGYFKGTTACLSALFTAGRHGEILRLLDLAPYKMWAYRRWGVKALAAMGKRAAALRYAEDSAGPGESRGGIARACEEMLLASGLIEEAYRRYALEANRRTTHLATFRAIAKKYPHKEAAVILGDLAAATPGEEGKWFAAAKEAGLYREAIELAHRSPCDPRTLTRAARDMAEREPSFAAEAGLAALRWIAAGYGYDITGADVLAAYHYTMRAAERAGRRGETVERIRRLIADDSPGARFLGQVLKSALE